MQLRKDVCDWIEKHKARYEPFVEDERGIDVHLRLMRQPGMFTLLACFSFRHHALWYRIVRCGLCALFLCARVFRLLCGSTLTGKAVHASIPRLMLCAFQARISRRFTYSIIESGEQSASSSLSASVHNLGAFACCMPLHAKLPTRLNCAWQMELKSLPDVTAPPKSPSPFRPHIELAIPVLGYGGCDVCWLLFVVVGRFVTVHQPPPTNAYDRVASMISTLFILIIPERCADHFFISSQI